MMKIETTYRIQWSAVVTTPRNSIPKLCVLNCANCLYTFLVFVNTEYLYNDQFNSPLIPVTLEEYILCCHFLQENVYSYVGNGPDVLPQQPVAPPVLSEFDYAIDKSLGMNLDKPSGHREDDLILQENRYENSFAVHQDGFPPDKEYYQNLRSIANAADKPSKENEYDANSNRCSSNGPINKDNEKDIYNQLNHGNQQAVVMKTRDPSYSHLQPLGTYQSTVPRPLSVPQAEYIYQNQSELYEDRIKMVWI